MSSFWKNLNPSTQEPVDHTNRSAEQRHMSTKAESPAQAEGLLSWIDLIGQR